MSTNVNPPDPTDPGRGPGSQRWSDFTAAKQAHFERIALLAEMEGFSRLLEANELPQEWRLAD